MFLYSKLGCGPSSIVYPMGSRVNRLPEELRGFKEYKIVQWQGDDSIVSCNNVLLAINQHLIYSPILVQGFVKHPNTVYLALPFEPNKSKPLISFGQSENSEYLIEESNESQEKTEENIEIKENPIKIEENIEKKEEKEDLEHSLLDHELVKKLNTFLNLSNFCGFIEMIDLGSKKESKWFVYDLHFGIPFFDGKLNNSMLLKIKTSGLLDSKKIFLHSKESRKLSLSLLSFISQYSQESVGLKENIPYPESVIVFHQGKIYTK